MDVAVDRFGFPPHQLVFEEQQQEVKWVQWSSAGLLNASRDAIDHARELEQAESRLECLNGGHQRTSRSERAKAAGPRRKAPIGRRAVRTSSSGWTWSAP